MAVDPGSTQDDEYFFFWPGGALFHGRVQDNTRHSHHALQIVVGTHRAFRLYDGHQWHRTRAAVIAPDHPHRLDGAGGRQLLLLIEPELEHVRRLTTALLAQDNLIRPPPEQLVSLASEFNPNGERASCEQARSVADRLLTLLDAAPTTRTTPMDPRLVKTLAMMRKLDFRKAAAADIACQVHLSTRRLSHLFKAQVGIPIRRYLLWLRLTEAVREMLVPASFTTAAHAAGFADAAHLSRTFRRMFGLSPSELFKNSRFVQAFLCRSP